jgi:lysozyme family protein
MNFDQAFDALIDIEKGYSDNPADPGGATMYGITERVARARGYAGDMRELPLSFAKAVAKADYWDAFKCDQFDPAIGFAVFDCAYNGGHPAQWLQEAAGVTVDGIIGAKTIAALRAADPMKIVMRFTAYRLKYMKDRKIWPSFSRGWADRIANNLILGAA